MKNRKPFSNKKFNTNIFLLILLVILILILIIFIIWRNYKKKEQFTTTNFPLPQNICFEQIFENGVLDLSQCSITSISKGSFKDNSLIKEVHFPASLKTIGDDAFISCVNLTKVVFSPISKLTEIGRNSFLGCNSLSKINLPNSLKTIGVKSFLNSQMLTTLNLPLNIKTIKKNAFLYSGIKELNFFVNDDFINTSNWDVYAFFSRSRNLKTIRICDTSKGMIKTEDIKGFFENNYAYYKLTYDNCEPTDEEIKCYIDKHPDLKEKFNNDIDKGRDHFNVYVKTGKEKDRTYFCPPKSLTTIPQTIIPQTTIPQTTIPQTTIPQTTLSTLNTTELEDSTTLSPFISTTNSFPVSTVSEVANVLYFF